MNFARAAGIGLALLLTACGGHGPVLEPTAPVAVVTDTPGIVPTAGQASPDPSPIPSSEEAPQSPGEEDSCLSRGGEVALVEIPAAEEVLIARIYTPPCYQAEPGESYPVLYIFHGDTKDEQQWDALGLVEWTDNLIKEAEIPPLIIVMPREYTWINPPDNPFGDQIVQTIIPWVDAQYRTKANRQYRAVGGLSRGGNWAVRLGFLHWGLFGSIGAHSTPLFFGDLNRLPGWVDAIPESMLPRIRIDIGEADSNLAESDQFHQILTEMDIPHQWHASPGYHDDLYWASQIETYLRWYSADWKD